ncbi:hypothetical protein QCA50_011752 [Cerrena zonata]|uniref:Uncharacterized protein n=1 Tax=Cerrena zonata TaxID=2478898 RepID=A0AAW0G4N0_9APHY
MGRILFLALCLSTIPSARLPITFDTLTYPIEADLTSQQTLYTVGIISDISILRLTSCLPPLLTPPITLVFFFR